MEEEKTYEDKKMVCFCGVEFIWTRGEQAFLNDLATQGKINAVQQPKRCPPCRQEHKAQRERRQNSEY